MWLELSVAFFLAKGERAGEWECGDDGVKYRGSFVSRVKRGTADIYCLHGGESVVR